jgi:predicted Fe-Mo cluster-binding NifX family protein
MIYAIPSKQGHLCQHFTKAEQFSLIDHNNSLLASVDNPAAQADASCHDKSAIVQYLQSMKVEAVIVKNIGERLLGKLLDAGLKVFQVNQIRPLALLINSPMQQLSEPSQGRPSIQHAKKAECGQQHQNGDHQGSGGANQRGCHKGKQHGQHSGKRCCH